MFWSRFQLKGNPYCSNDMRSNGYFFEVSAIILVIITQAAVIISHNIFTALFPGIIAACLLSVSARSEHHYIRGYQSFVALSAVGLLANTIALYAIVRGLWQGWPIATWLLSIICIFSSTLSSAEKPASQPAELPAWISPVTRYALLAVCIGTAFFFRSWQITSIPQSIWYDELMTAKNAILIMEHEGVSPFQATPLALGDVVSNLYLYYVILIFKLFGVNYFAVKMVSVIPAAAIILATYFLGCKFMSKEFAIMAAFFVAVSHWHISISRIGWSNVMMSLLQVCSYSFFLYGLGKKIRGFAFLSGILMGLCCYTYAASRLALAILIIFIIVFYFFNKDNRGSIMTCGAWFALGSLIILAPLINYYTKNPHLLTHRLNQVSIIDFSAPAQTLMLVMENAKKYLLMFHFSGEQWRRFNPGGNPMLDPVFGILFLAGILYVCLRWRKAYTSLLPLWIIGGLLGGIFSQSAPTGFRTFLIIPAVALTGGLAFEQLCILTNRGFPHLSRAKIFIVLSMPMLIFMAIFNYRNYFNCDDFWKVWELNYLTEPTQIGRYIQKLAPENPVYIYDAPFWQFEPAVDTLKVLAYQPYNEHTKRGGYNDPPFIHFDLQMGSPWRIPPAQKIFYITMTEQKHLVQSLFSGAEWQEIINPAGEVLFCSATIHAVDIAKAASAREIKQPEQGKN